VNDYAISYKTNLTISNGTMFFECHREIVTQLSSVIANILEGDPECTEICLRDISNDGLITLERLIYDDFEKFWDLENVQMKDPDSMFLLLTKYGFPIDFD